jgi:hypothetical protein
VSTRAENAAEHRLRHINVVRARLLQVFGPADSWDSPLTDTKYDPVVRQHQWQERRKTKHAGRLRTRAGRSLELRCRN